MKTKTVYLLAGVLVGLVVVSPWEGDSEAATGPATIRITNVQDTVVRVDVGSKGKSPGDMEIIRQRLYNQRVTTRSIGRSELVCTFMDRRRARVCRGTYFLPKGKDRRRRVAPLPAVLRLAVLGGTGLYDNARGTLVVTRTGVHPVRDRMVFRLVG